MELTSDTGLTMIIYSAEPGSPSADAPSLLASLHAQPAEPENEESVQGSVDRY